MPIYEYSCKKCGEVIERIQSFRDPPLKKHEECGGSLTKLISQSAFQLKGTGWYVTDYAKSGADEQKAGEDGSTSSDKGADKKIADKADTSDKNKKDTSAKKEKSGPDK